MPREPFAMITNTARSIVKAITSQQLGEARRLRAARPVHLTAMTMIRRELRCASTCQILAPSAARFDANRASPFAAVGWPHISSYGAGEYRESIVAELFRSAQKNHARCKGCEQKYREHLHPS